MLDLSQFEGYSLSGDACILLTECRRLQENNQELVKFLIKVKEEYDYAMFDNDRAIIDELIAKNKEQETNDRPTDKSTI